MNTEQNMFEDALNKKTEQDIFEKAQGKYSSYSEYGVEEKDYHSSMDDENMWDGNDCCDQCGYLECECCPDCECLDCECGLETCDDSIFTQISSNNEQDLFNQASNQNDEQDLFNQARDESIEVGQEEFEKAAKISKVINGDQTAEEFAQERLLTEQNVFNSLKKKIEQALFETVLEHTVD